MMKLSDVNVPLALGLFLDDVGWMVGRDDRTANGPSRTGLPRRHCLADYQALEELGRALGIKIGCAFVIGEWDRHNILRRVTDATPWGERWDCSKFLDEKEAAEIRDYVNSSSHIDLALHGLLHECFRGGKYVGGQEFITRSKKTGAYRLRPTSYIREHIDAFYEIYNDWGFTQKLVQFASPGGHCALWNEDRWAKTLASYGIRYWCNARLPASTVKSGIIINSMGGDFAPWNAFDIDPDYLPDYSADRSGMIGGHWPNVLRYNPENNFEYIPKWKAYFDRQCEHFGLYLAADIPACQRQQLMRKNHTETETDGRVLLDFTAADAMMPKDLPHDVVVSVKKSAGVPVFEGADAVDTRERGEFVNYTLRRKGSLVFVG